MSRSASKGDSGGLLACALDRLLFLSRSRIRLQLLVLLLRVSSDRGGGALWAIGRRRVTSRGSAGR